MGINLKSIMLRREGQGKPKIKFTKIKVGRKVMQHNTTIRVTHLVIMKWGFLKHLVNICNIIIAYMII